MDIFKELERITLQQHTEGELPAWLAEPALAVARNRDKYLGKEYLVEILADQIREYDIHADTGCCKWAYDHEDVKRTLGWLDS